MTISATPAKSITPLVIHNIAAAALLEIRWSDGTISRLHHRDLRQACPCAWCRAARLRGDIREIDPDVRVITVNTMGYGLQLVFNDGHDRGIYPWIYLNTLDSQVNPE